MSLPGDRAAIDDLLDAITLALRLPIAALDSNEASAQRAILLEHRTRAVRDAVRAARLYGDIPTLVRHATGQLRSRIDQLPITYRMQLRDERGDIRLVCSDACCNPGSGIHDSCPGPAAGRVVTR